jgi:hypothetical protein
MRHTFLRYLLDGKRWACFARLTTRTEGAFRLGFSADFLNARWLDLDFTLCLGWVQVSLSFFDREGMEQYYEDTGNYGN